MSAAEKVPTVLPIEVGWCRGERLLLPVANAFLARSGARWAVVDTGPPGNAPRILAEIRRQGLAPEDISAILLTHGHFDHYGSVAELKRLLPPGVPVVAHPADRPLLETGRFPTELRPIAPFAAPALAGGALFMLLWKLSGTLRPWPEELLQEVLWLDPAAGPVPLEPLCGFGAEAFHTPGHSSGSVSFRLPTGEVLIGDQPPLLIEDREQARFSLQCIAACNPHSVYRGHGRPMSADGFHQRLRPWLPPGK